MFNGIQFIFNPLSKNPMITGKYYNTSCRIICFQVSSKRFFIDLQCLRSQMTVEIADYHRNLINAVYQILFTNEEDAYKITKISAIRLANTSNS